MIPRLSTPSRPRARASRDDAAANEVYDAACELLLAARELERAAARDGTASVLPATLGCLEEALQALAGGVHELGSEALLRLAQTLADEEFVTISRRFGGIRHDLLGARTRIGALRSALAARAAQRPS